MLFLARAERVRLGRSDLSVGRAGGVTETEIKANSPAQKAAKNRPSLDDKTILIWPRAYYLH